MRALRKLFFNVWSEVGYSSTIDPQPGHHLLPSCFSVSHVSSVTLCLFFIYRLLTRFPTQFVSLLVASDTTVTWYQYYLDCFVGTVQLTNDTTQYFILFIYFLRWFQVHSVSPRKLLFYCMIQQSESQLAFSRPYTFICLGAVGIYMKTGRWISGVPPPLAP